MADNLLQTGSGNVRTIDRSSVHTQQFGIDVAQSGESERLGLPPTRLITITSAGLTTGATAYTAGDVLGTEMELANAARYTAGGLSIVSALLIDKANIVGPVNLYVFDRASSPAADNAAMAWADADMANLVAIINFSVPTPSTNNRAGVAVGGLPMVVKPNATSLFAVAVTLTAHTFFGAATDLIFKLGVISD